MPIGTIRHWKSGTVIKAHEGSIFANGWIPLTTNEHFNAKGSKADSVAQEILQYKEPVPGEDLLDYLILHFENESGDPKEAKYKPDDFKKYEGFYGAGRYAFRNEFSRLAMEPKLKLADVINQRLVEANPKDSYGPEKADDLSAAEKKAIRDQARKEFEEGTLPELHGYQPFKIEDVDNILEILKETREHLRRGFDVGEKQPTLDDIVKRYNTFVDEYMPLKDVRAEMRDLFQILGAEFKDNVVVSMGLQKNILKAFDQYREKYRDKIREDSREEALAALGVEIDAKPAVFYSALKKTIESFTKEAEEVDLDSKVGSIVELGSRVYRLEKRSEGLILASLGGDRDVNIGNDSYNSVSEIDVARYFTGMKDLPFDSLFNARFNLLYNKRLEGNWNYLNYGALVQTEVFMLSVPEGHAISNDVITAITQTDYNGGDHDGYAWYNKSLKRINFSSEAVGQTQVIGSLENPEEFKAVMVHEMGHAVSAKLGAANSMNYRKFVVACGWSYGDQPEIKTLHATGDDKDIYRGGSQSHIKLLTDYAHKSPEEAFAEYYSIYHLNKKEIDKWLDTNDTGHLKKTQALVMSGSKLGGHSIGTDSLTKRIVRKYEGSDKPDPRVLVGNIERSLSHLDGSQLEVQPKLISPWNAKKHDDNNEAMDVDRVRRNLKRKDKSYELTVVVQHGPNDYRTIANHEGTVYAQYKKLGQPAVVVSRDFYHNARQNGYSREDIAAYAVIKASGHNTPKAEQVTSKKIEGLAWRNQILEVSDLMESKKPFEAMRHVYHSNELKKALQELFALGEAHARYTLYSEGFDQGLIDDEVFARAYSDLEKAKKGRYVNNAHNRKLGRVGMPYGKEGKKNEESPSRKYIRQLGEITTGKQKEYFDWQLKNARDYDIVSISKLPESVQQAVKAEQIEMKQCYKNAAQISMRTGAKYVEGIALFAGSIPIEHAWNEIDGQAFDPTMEMLFGKNSNMSHYLGFVSLDREELTQHLLDSESYGPHASQVFLNEKSKDIKKSEKTILGITKNILSSAFRVVFNSDGTIEEKTSYADAIVLNGRGEVLMLRRSSNESNPDQWSLPGGHIDPGETPASAAVRELMEETNLQAVSCFPYHRIEDEKAIVHYFICEVDDFTPMLVLDANEHYNWEWVDKDRLQELDCVFDLKDILNETVFNEAYDRPAIRSTDAKSANDFEVAYSFLEKGWRDDIISLEVYQQAKEKYEAFMKNRQPAKPGEIRLWNNERVVRTADGWESLVV